MMLRLLSLLLLLGLGAATDQAKPQRGAGRPLCTPENLKLQNASDGTFFLLPDGSFRYEFEHCQLRRFTSQAAAKCLRGTHLVFMGDSLSRYFYLALTHLLSRRRWTTKFAKYPAHTNRPRSILSERDYKNWALFYKDTNQILSSNPYSFEICDCYRNDSRTWNGENDPEGKHQQLNCYENRHYRYIPTKDYNDQENDVRLSYIQWYGLMPMRGHNKISILPRNASVTDRLRELNKEVCPTETFWPLSLNCSDKREIENWDFRPFFHSDLCSKYPIPDPDGDCGRFEERTLGGLGATHLIMNIGWHSGIEEREDGMGHRFLRKVVGSAEKFFKYPGPDNEQHRAKDNDHTKGWGNIRLPRVTWRTSTAYAVFSGSTDKVAREYFKEVGRNTMELFEIHEMTGFLKTLHHRVKDGDHEQVRKMVRPHKTWPAHKDINASTVPTTYVDEAHPEPWAYAEIHNIFLSAICPV